MLTKKNKLTDVNQTPNGLREQIGKIIGVKQGYRRYFSGTWEGLDGITRYGKWVNAKIPNNKKVDAILKLFRSYIEKRMPKERQLEGYDEPDERYNQALSETKQKLLEGI